MSDDKKFIFIQTPDDMDADEADEMLMYLYKVSQQMGSRYSFVLCSANYKAMEADEIREMIDYLMAKV